MADFYLSYKALDKMYSSNRDYAIIHMNICKNNTIYVDLTDEEIANLEQDDDLEYPSNCISQMRNDHGTNFISAIDVCQKIKDNTYKEADSSPKSIFILDMPSQDAIQRQKDTGLLCMSDDVFSLDALTLKCTKYLEVPSETSLPESKERITWDDILNHAKGIPCNTILINDHYLFGDDQYNSDRTKVNRDEFKNIVEILNCVLPQKSQDDLVQILFVHDNAGDANDLGTISSAIKKKIKDLRDYRITTEFISGNRNCYLFEHTHNRNIVTNYYIISAEHKLAAFKNGFAASDQRVSFQTLYSEGINDGSDTPERYQEIIINRIRSIAKYGMDHETSGYKFSQNGNANPAMVSIKNIKNRFVTYSK